ncbi:hypothetical protein DK148_21805 [Shigella flexneri]|nr:hypothetical protein [Shigella flexneri]
MFKTLIGQGKNTYIGPDFLPKIVTLCIKIRKNIKKEGENRPLFFVLKVTTKKGAESVSRSQLLLRFILLHAK